ncbi:hypothetical protein M514_09233 [Trichuris suis]|uniref:Uncharacterized protein n=1 Tax=Trichuris suis TaxID=68888 RepID=A0A085LY58_9BILA|nr:hypothetical protein M513_09233 [Trichuris suis]KFD70273.1 hypothetical protein M514_09233 [Trichuris suis]
MPFVASQGLLYCLKRKKFKAKKALAAKVYADSADHRSVGRDGGSGTEKLPSAATRMSESRSTAFYNFGQARRHITANTLDARLFLVNEVSKSLLTPKGIFFRLTKLPIVFGLTQNSIH